jgi:hypothetical protein
MRKMVFTISLVVVGSLMTAAPAFAHECYNTSRSAQGNQSIAAHTSTFVTFDEVAYDFLTQAPDGPGLCDAGANYLIGLLDANAASLGLSPDTVVFMNAVQAGGVGHAKDVPAIQVLSNGKGIDHLAENAALNDFLGAHIGDAFALCGP